VALLGATGSGKSSLVHLLQRLYDYQEGSVTINGVELNTIDKAHLRAHVGIVLQEPFLYGKTVKDNIGIIYENPDLDAVKDAAKVAAVHDVITGFEKGYETIVGERGVTLSGGQKQRVAIARTLMKDNDVLIFDDSLSAVDTETDAAIRKALKTRRAGITTFIISHRVSTLSEADRILVLEDGHITQNGTHEQLLAQDGLYRRIWTIQNALEEEMQEDLTQAPREEMIL
jgi:ATP-binding cassette subfamily B protein